VVEDEEEYLPFKHTAAELVTYVAKQINIKDEATLFKVLKEIFSEPLELLTYSFEVEPLLDLIIETYYRKTGELKQEEVKEEEAEYLPPQVVVEEISPVPK